MQQKQRLFIYDRKEMGVLLLLAVLVAVFAFTLGVHLGKRVGGTPAGTEASPLPLAESAEDQVPTGQDLSDQAKAAQAEAEQAIDQAAHEEVDRTGLKLDRPKQVELPKESKAERAKKEPAGTAEKPAPAIEEAAAPSGKEASSPEDKTLETLTAFTRQGPGGKYALQIGSHPRLEAAKEQVSQAESAGLKPLLRVVELKDRGRWYRIFIGGYASREQADKSGKELKSRGLIESYVVANAVK